MRQRIDPLVFAYVAGSVEQHFPYARFSCARCRHHQRHDSCCDRCLSADVNELTKPLSMAQLRRLAKKDEHQAMRRAALSGAYAAMGVAVTLALLIILLAPSLTPAESDSITILAMSAIFLVMSSATGALVYLLARAKLPRQLL